MSFRLFNLVTDITEQYDVVVRKQPGGLAGQLFSITPAIRHQLEL